MSHFGVIIQLEQIFIIKIWFLLFLNILIICKVNNEIIDFRHSSDIYIRTADFVIFYLIFQ